MGGIGICLTAVWPSQRISALIENVGHILGDRDPSIDIRHHGSHLYRIRRREGEAQLRQLVKIKFLKAVEAVRLFTGLCPGDQSMVSEKSHLDLLRRDPRVCISFVGANQAAQDDFTTYFQSACVEGEAAEVLDREEKLRALRALCEKLTPAHMTEDNFDRAMERSLARTGVWKIRIRSLTGKEKPRP